MANHIKNQFAQRFSLAEENHDLLAKLCEKMLDGDTCVLLNQTELQQITQQANVAQGNESQPLVVEHQRLYTQRNWLYESNLASSLLDLSNTATTEVIQNLDAYFADEHQKQAAKLALSHSLAIITGGPGTGKTTTVVKILALLLEQNPQLDIALCAPTGKAAMRLQESIANGIQDEQNVAKFFDQSTLDSIPEQVSTIHRMLGSLPNSVQFRHHQENPLRADIVVVDEASMIDLALMAKLVNALKPGAKLILLGDKDQLASVESGAVLADCYEGLQNNRVNLVTTYRFGGVIKDLAEAINQCLDSTTLDIIDASNQHTPAQLCWLDDNPVSYAKRAYGPYLQAAKSTASRADIAPLFGLFNEFQVLSPTRYLLDQFNGLGGKADGWYIGKPIMISENNQSLGLYNGDIGICMPDFDGDAGKLRVWFYSQDQLRSFIPARLPKHESAYAITIHKSQGSEFKQVLMLVPETLPEQGVFTKELVYTAITRAKQSVVIQHNRESLSKMISKSVTRHSGLAQRFL